MRLAAPNVPKEDQRWIIMKLFKNIKVKMLNQPEAGALEKLATVLFEDEEVLNYFESEKAMIAFTSKRMIYVKGKEQIKAIYIFSYRNIAAYGISKNQLTLALINSPEYSRFVLKVPDIKAVTNEAGEVVEEAVPAAEKLNDLCRFLGNLIW